ncbi:MAG: hypothetical protein HQ518_16460 [Rhodopirellula sp.]|nr:hypothetical protein [Rhodopirellula sp.]
MSNYDPTNDILNPTRRNPLLALVTGVVFLVINHFFVEQFPGALKLLAAIGTLFVTLGIAGLIDPRLFYGVMDQSKGAYPAWVRPASITLVIVGLLAGLALLVSVYKAFP